jgi:hypothetical protein
MKIVSILALLILSQTAQSFCRYENAYIGDGWNVINSSEFKKHEIVFFKTLNKGLEDGSIVADISGPILTNDTVTGEEMLFDGIMWDNLKTDRDIMYGDYAIVVNPNDQTEVAELRWFDGAKRNIVYNPSILKCQSEAPPYVSNSVF